MEDNKREENTYLKKKNKKKSKGFTLIELLATITLIGILSLIAIPSISRAIEKARRNTYVSVVKNYIEAVKIRVANDGITCGDSVISGVPNDGYYYLMINSGDTTGQDLLESGGKSPYGNSDIKGAILMHKTEKGYKYYVALVDSQANGFGDYYGAGATIRIMISENNVDIKNFGKDLSHGVDRYGKVFYDHYTGNSDDSFFWSNGICLDKYCTGSDRIKNGTLCYLD